MKQYPLLGGIALFFNILVVGAVLSPTVHIDQGTLTGTIEKTANGRNINAFLGIPYARPPVGKYRFAPPQPPKPWRGKWNASTLPPMCLQYDHMNYLNDKRFAGDEDCLYVNVYTPLLPSGNSPLLDVFVYIHGGAFQSGAGFLYTPRYLLDQDVVFVTLNYRLGPLGFLTTEDEVVPGNNGLKDQVMALKWIQQNIAAFNGNPASVTISGMSAGGASVQYHYLSPMSQGLFHRGISMSGSSLTPFALVENGREKADRLAATLGCPTFSSRDLVDCLRYRPALQIVKLLATPLFMPYHYNPYSPFGPTVEMAGTEPFLSQSPYELLKSGQVKDIPWLASVTSEEGLYPTSNFVANATILSEIEERWDELAPHLLDYNYTIPQEKKVEVGRKIKNFYLKGKPVSPDTTSELTQMFGDRLYVVHVERAARLQAKSNTAPVYFYRFTYRGKHSYSEMMSWGSTENFGVSHGDDTAYVLGTFYGNPEETPQDKAMTRLMLNMWLTFAKTGKPVISHNVQWSPVKPEGDLDYLEINSSEDLVPKTSSDLGYRQFWDSLPFNEPVEPVAVKDEL
ncbi:unnamed protein product [Bemisia tabaci]|uniref:Carboxylesterase type B domain-containing protein n=1 Tax=Bemisia tabaci TaxID=7038 RepID=A0A9P0F6B2_BEMTA|nr:unnamed protein product [Bemisia tabaci]